MQILLNFLVIVCQVLTFAIVIRAILSWFALGPNHPLVAMLNHITEPVLAPLRRVMPRTGVIDITPLIAIILLQVVVALLSWV